MSDTLVLNSDLLDITNNTQRTLMGDVRTAYAVQDLVIRKDAFVANETLSFSATSITIIKSDNDVEVQLSATTNHVTMVGKYFVLPGAVNVVITNNLSVATNLEVIYS